MAAGSTRSTNQAETGINAGEHSRRLSAMPLLWINLARSRPHFHLL